MPRKPEMSQLYNSNEFIFGEKGGKGKNLSTFLKNLSLTNSQEFKDNSSIYGSLKYPQKQGNESKTSLDRRDRSSSPSKGRSVSGNSFLTGLTPTTSTHNSSPTRGKRSVSAKYSDLDDDWDANFDTNKSKGGASDAGSPKAFGGNYQQPMFVDSFYPDLSIVNTSKPSVDLEDIKVTKEITKLNQLHAKFGKFKTILEHESNINIQELRKLSWNGIPSQLRPLVWQLLLGYLPTNKSRQQSTLKIKRQEYIDGIHLIEQTVNFDDVKNIKDNQLYHQINIDVKRTNPGMKLYGESRVQKSLRKVLYFWAIRHPASGYVQGINDLVTPFYQLFLGHYIWQIQKLRDVNYDDYSGFIPGLSDQSTKLLDDPKLETYSIENIDPNLIDEHIHLIIEADTYWCLSRLLENITDNYIHEQPGIIKQVNDLHNLIGKIDLELVNHFQQEGIEFIQFSFRWMNCLLMRELPLPLIIRMWDTYLSEQPLGFNHFHVYVCAAFLIKFSNDLKCREFQEILLFLQNPPTQSWGEKDVELMLSEAFIWQSLYKNSAHLR